LSEAHQGIFMSILLRASLPATDAHQLTLVTALSLVKAIQQCYRLRASIKWPNDVLLQGKKVAGILTEMQSDQDSVRFLVIGIGINVNYKPEELQGPFRYPATSLAIQLGARVERQRLLTNLLKQLELDYENLLKEGFGVFRAEFEQNSGLLGKNAIIHCGAIEHTGKVIGFTSHGALRLLTIDKREEIIWVGDVTQVEGDS
jgi:BirA family transcriptional regulator, biotin operon repressor / biotin---[acetyl-CoA-carboxylase] ligase